MTNGCWRNLVQGCCQKFRDPTSIDPPVKEGMKVNASPSSKSDELRPLADLVFLPSRGRPRNREWSFSLTGRGKTILARRTSMVCTFELEHSP